MSDKPDDSDDPQSARDNTCPTVSILVISYNTREMTLECLRSVVRETQQVSYELIVVDNQSTDGSAEAIAQEFPELRLIRPEGNLGFAKANNLAATEAHGEFLLLLNPDTVILDRAIDRLIEFAREHPDAGIWGGRTLNADRSLNPASCWGRMTLWSLLCRAVGLNVLFPGSELFNYECYGNWPRDRVREVDIVTGCFLLIRRELWKRLNGFDPAFFMYGEEADLCLRAKQLGVRAMISPDPTIIHYGGASETIPLDKRTKLLRGQITLMRRHWSGPCRWIGVQLLIASQLVRCGGYRVVANVTRSERHEKQARIWQDIWRLRHQWSQGYS